MTTPPTKQISAEDCDFVLSRLEDSLTETFHDEKVLLTGATGFFGKWLTQILLAANDRLKLRNEFTFLTRSRSSALQSLPWLRGRHDVNWIESDIRTWNAGSSDLIYSSIIHGAAAASLALNKTQPTEMFDTIVDGTKNVLAHAKHAKRILFISSGAIYGPQPPTIGWLSEQSQLRETTSAYAQAKRVAEKLCLESSANSNLTVARCFAFIGPYLPLETHFAAGNFTARALAGETIKIGGDGTPYRSYLYAADLAVWLLTIFLSGKSKSVYNVGSDKPISILELAGAFSHTHNPTLEIEIAGTPEPGVPPERYIPSIAKARNELGLEVWTPLEEAIGKTLNWYRS